MPSIALRPLLHGAAELAAGPHGGLVPHRLPQWAREQHNSMMFNVLEQFPAGVALRFVTAADRVTLKLRTTVIEPEGAAPGPLPRIAVVEHSAQGESAGPTTASARTYEIPRGDVIRIAADQSPLGREERAAAHLEVTLHEPQGTVEILLPHNCMVELLELSAATPIEPAPTDSRPRWVHYGSSISHGLEAPSPDRTWPGIVALSQGWNLRNLAFAGHAQLDPFVARIIGDIPTDLITLKVGINLVNADSMRERALLPALHGFLDTIRERNSAPIVLMSAITCPAHEHAPGPSVTRGQRTGAARRNIEVDDGALTLAHTRRALADVVRTRGARDANLFLMAGPQLFGPDDVGLLPDGLHPSPEGLALIAQRFPAQLAAVLPAVLRLQVAQDR